MEQLQRHWPQSQNLCKRRSTLEEVLGYGVDESVQGPDTLVCATESGHSEAAAAAFESVDGDSNLQ